MQQTFVVFTIQILISVAGWQSSEQSGRNCLQGLLSCQKNQHCNTFIEAVPNVCGETANSCMTNRRAHCQNVLHSLQQNENFRHCICEDTELHHGLCESMKRTIFQHKCLENPPDINNGGQLEMSTVTTSTLLNDNELPELEIETQFSCIAIRKHCLTDNECRKHLSDFRIFCRENKKRGLCVTKEREQCYEKIKGLAGSDLFTCECHMKRHKTRMKCDRIQDRIANNTCLASVPYFLHSTKSEMDTYEDMMTIMKARQHEEDIARHFFTGSTCIEAVKACDKQNDCRNRLQDMFTACEWDVESIPEGCNKPLCLVSIRKFFQIVDETLTRDMLFCRCDDNDEKCMVIKNLMYPKCSTIDTPPPTCSFILKQCELDPECSKRWAAYETYCTYDKMTGGCSLGPEKCREAQIGIMGTIITTNCTCSASNPTEYHRCMEARTRLQHDNVCKEIAELDYHSMYLPTPKLPQISNDKDTKAYVERGSCLMHVGHNIPSYMTFPSVVRVYQNDSECSNVCHCLANGTMSCKKLPCKPTLDCVTQYTTHRHGSTFEDKKRGQCRCIESEIVCAKLPDIAKKQRMGLYLHIGYSLTDQYLIERHTDIKFDVSRISHTLGALLNQDSAAQFCKLLLYHKEDGNLVFEIKSSDFSRRPQGQKKCETATESLSYMINSRQPTIVTDAELSILKVAEFERALGEGHHGGLSSHSENLRHLNIILYTIVMWTFLWSFVP